MRPFSLKDAADLARLAGDKAIADTTLLVPHPYEKYMAEEWICTHASSWDRKNSVVWAAVLRDTAELIGAFEVSFNLVYDKANLGYWVGKPYRGNGYATEAVRAIIDWVFENLGLNRIDADHMSRNPASGAVMKKAGMVHEATLRQYYKKWGQFEDVELYAILREDWLKRA